MPVKLGIGMAVAVAIDATLIRGVLPLPMIMCDDGPATPDCLPR